MKDWIEIDDTNWEDIMNKITKRREKELGVSYIKPISSTKSKNKLNALHNTKKKLAIENLVDEDIEDAWYNDDWTEEDEDDIENYEEDNPITPEQEAFANEIRSLLQSLIDNEEAMDEEEIEEAFTSQNNLMHHFNKHCLGNSTTRQSTKNNIYYDFKTPKRYSKYEQRINLIFKHGQYDYIDSIYDIDSVNKKFTKLFEGNQYLFVSAIFGLTNSKGSVSLGIHAFSSDVTTNYKAGNTIDICIMTQSPKTIKLYPVDASTLKKELLRIFKNFSTLSFTPSKDNSKLLDNLQNKNVLKEKIENEDNYLDKLDLKSNGIYSLNTGWVKHPVQQDIPDIDMEEFEKEFKVWEDKYFDLLDELGESINEITESTKVNDKWKKELLDFVDLKLQNQEEVYSNEIRTQSKDNSSPKYIHLNSIGAIDMYDELKLNGYNVKWIEKDVSFVVKR